MYNCNLLLTPSWREEALIPGFKILCLNYAQRRALYVMKAAYIGGILPDTFFNNQKPNTQNHKPTQTKAHQPLWKHLAEVVLSIFVCITGIHSHLQRQTGGKETCFIESKTYDLIWSHQNFILGLGRFPWWHHTLRHVLSPQASIVSSRRDVASVGDRKIHTFWGRENKHIFHPCC